MIVTDRDFLRPVCNPNETDPPLIIDADRVLAFALAGERFKLISRRHREIPQLLCSVELQQLAEGNSSDIPVPLKSFVDPEFLRVLVAEGKNHRLGYDYALTSDARLRTCIDSL
jgi:hypothetical protein